MDNKINEKITAIFDDAPLSDDLVSTIGRKASEFEKRKTNEVLKLTKQLLQEIREKIASEKDKKILDEYINNINL